MIHVTEVDTSCYDDTMTGAEFCPELPAILRLRSVGYSVEIEEYYRVFNQKPQGENSCYLVAKTKTHTKPLNEADAVADGRTLYVCEFWDYWQKMPEVDDGELLGQWDESEDKHCKAVMKHNREIAADGQDTLV